MEDSISNLRVKFDHPQHAKPQHSLYKHAPIVYGAKIQYAAGPDDSPPLHDAGVLRVQTILGALLFYACDVENKLLVALSNVGQQQASATKSTNDTITKILDYVATYPSDGINFRASNMVMSAHSDPAYLNFRKARIRAGAHIMLSEHVPVPRYNGPVIASDQIIKCVMSSAAEADLDGLYICPKEMVPLRQTLVKMGWPQPQSHIQYDNSTDIGLANETITPARKNQCTYNYTGCNSGMHRASLGPSGHLVPTTLANIAQRTILKSITSTNGRSDILHFTSLD